jgi:SAM-dependent methyltransferase
MSDLESLPTGPAGMTGVVDPSESRAAPSQYATADRLKDRLALHQLYGEENENFHSWLFRQVQAPANAAVLEVGCGTGALWQVNRGKVPKGWRLTLTDLSEAMLRESQYNLRDDGLEVVYNRHGAQRLPYPDNAFDVVFANHMLYHVADVPEALAEIRRVLKPSGRLYAATNGEEHMAEVAELRQRLLETVPRVKSAPIDLSTFSMESGSALLREHFDDVRLFERRDQLIVTDPEPLIRYVLSLFEPMTMSEASTSALALWRQSVVDSFVGGIFSIKRVTGFFEAL